MRSHYVLITALLMLFTFSSYAQETGSAKQQKAKNAGSSRNDAVIAKIKDAWEAFKTKNKQTFAEFLAPRFTAVEEDGKGARDKDSTVAEINDVTIESYSLSDFKTHPLGAGAMLVNYKVHQSGTAGGKPLPQDLYVTELWENHGGKWQSAFYQETVLK